MPLIGSTLFPPPGASAPFGGVLGPVGDVNGDGFEDMAVAAPGAAADPEGGGEPRPGAGRVTVLFGGPSGLPHLQPLAALTPQQGFYVEGGAAFDRAGTALTAVGDINGDGFGDFWIGAPGADGTRTETYTETYSTTEPRTYTPPDSGYTRSYFYTASGGTYTYSTGLPGEIIGTAQTYVTTYTGVPRTYEVPVAATRSYTRTVAEPDVGTGYLIFGAAAPEAVDLATGPSGGAVPIIGAGAGDAAGAGLLAVGDFTGDGHGDVALLSRYGGSRAGQEGSDETGPGVLAIFPGGALPAPGSAGVDLAAPPPGTVLLTNPGSYSAATGTYRTEGNPTRFGAALAGGWDVNGDAYADLAIGAPGQGGGAGAAYVVFGAAGGGGPVRDVSALSGADGFAFRGTGTEDRVGWALASSGDLTGDGRGEIIVGAPGAAGGAGRVYVLFGPSGASAPVLTESDLGPGVGFALTGRRAGAALGQSLSAPGDMDGDGWADLALVEAAPATGEVMVHVLFGGPGLPLADASTAAIDGTIGYSFVFNLAAGAPLPAVSGADMNGDGRADLLLGPVETPLLGAATRILYGGPRERWAALDALDASSNGRIDGSLLDQPIIVGTGGADQEAGSGAAERFYGLGGDDTLEGGSGADTLEGGDGNDLYVVDAAGAIVLETEGAGDDTLRAGYSAVLPDHVEVLELGGIAPLSGMGGAGADGLFGNTAANWLRGLGGADTLSGGGGTDTLEGGTGDDFYIVEDGTVQVIEAAGEGEDTIAAAVSYDLPDWVEALWLTGAAAIDGTGGDGADRILGNGAANGITGGRGADTLEGGGGSDTLDGGSQNDSLTGGSGADSLIGRFGEDTLSGGDGADTLEGNGGADALFGDAGDDSLLGGDGDDRLEGGAGADTLAGGPGNDRLIWAPGDTVVELPGEGIDTLVAAVDAALPDGVEVLVLTGPAERGTGSTGDDMIQGSDRANVLIGGGGADTIAGGGGDDSLFGEDGDDSLTGGGGKDSIEGGEGSDHVGGGSGNDKLFGGPQGDTLDGGNGRDRLTGGSGADTLLGGEGDDQLFGQSGADLLQGGAGRDSLNGGNGPDTLAGGAGNDILRGEERADRFEFSLSDPANTDRIADFTLGVDQLALSDTDYVASVTGGGDLQLDWASGHRLVLDGITDATALTDDIVPLF